MHWINARFMGKWRSAMGTAVPDVYRSPVRSFAGTRW